MPCIYTWWAEVTAKSIMSSRSNFVLPYISDTTCNGNQFSSDISGYQKERQNNGMMCWQTRNDTKCLLRLDYGCAIPSAKCTVFAVYSLSVHAIRKSSIFALVTFWSYWSHPVINGHSVVPVRMILINRTFLFQVQTQHWSVFINTVRTPCIS